MTLKPVLSLAVPVSVVLLSLAATLPANAADLSVVMVTAPRPEHTGTLTVEVTLDGAGSWRHPTNGEYNTVKIHRRMSYTVPLDGLVGGGSGFYNIDKREEKTRNPMAIPNFYRYLVLQPHAAMANLGTVCGRGTIEVSDVYQGMETGDPGQPPLVPYTQTWRGNTAFPSGDKTLSERDLCMTRVTLDGDKKVVHVLIDGSDSDVKTHVVHNGLEPSPPVNVRFEGETLDTPAKPKLTYFDVPVDLGRKSFELQRAIDDFSVVRAARGGAKVPLRALVKWRIEWK